MTEPRFSRRAALSLAALPTALGLAGCSSRGEAGEAPEPRMTDRLPDTPLVGHDGRAARFYSDLVADRPVLINFMYARCQGSCPATVGLLRRLRPEITRVAGAEVRILSVTLDPAHDTPRILADYARANAPEEPGLCEWRFLTGKPGDVDSLRRALGYWDPNPRVDADRSQHAAMLTFGNDRLDRWATMPVGIPERQMIRSIARILRGPGRTA
ncbi:SCO family protein [Tundrisphaera sp. TA3]|uniref:SCO family protein n=1 Tax=Tundrisphaera sp. TA3 TaxID=3435775 RepID=UPI003EBC9C22